MVLAAAGSGHYRVAGRRRSPLQVALDGTERVAARYRATGVVQVHQSWRVELRQLCSDSPGVLLCPLRLRHAFYDLEWRSAALSIASGCVRAFCRQAAAQRRHGPVTLPLLRMEHTMDS